MFLIVISFFVINANAQLFGEKFAQESKNGMMMGLFIGPFYTYNLWNDGDFNGNEFYIVEDGILVIPKLEPGRGWGIQIGLQMFVLSNLFIRNCFSVTQTFHSGHYLTDSLSARLLTYHFSFGIGYQLFDFFALYAKACWMIPYYLTIDQGYYRETEGFEFSYFGIEGVSAGLGVELYLNQDFSIFGEADYGLWSFGDVLYGEKAMRPTSYIETVAWQIRTGINWNYRE